MGGEERGAATNGKEEGRIERVKEKEREGKKETESNRKRKTGWGKREELSKVGEEGLEKTEKKRKK